MGSPVSSIELTEDRQMFAEHLKSIDIPVPPSGTAVNLQQAQKIAKTIGYPLMVRAAFALGGQKSGVAQNDEDLKDVTQKVQSYFEILLPYVIWRILIH